MSDKYILGGPDGHTPVPVGDLLEWAHWFEKADRIVKQEHIGPYFVSTVFLGLDHNYANVSTWLSKEPPKSAPVLFETMVFHGTDRGGEYEERCSTWEEAIRQHERIAAEFRKAQNG